MHAIVLLLGVSHYYSVLREQCTMEFCVSLSHSGEELCCDRESHGPSLGSLTDSSFGY